MIQVEVLRNRIASCIPALQNLEIESTALSYFRRFLCIKIAAPFVFHSGNFLHFDLQSILIVLALGIACLQVYYLPGLLGIWFLSAYDVFRSFPFTINHAGLELVVLTLLVLESGRFSKQRISTNLMIKILMMSVWVYSAMHKLFDGYFLNAEFFALEAFSDASSLGHKINQILNFIVPFFAQPLACCTVSTLAISNWHLGFLFSIAWMTIVIEFLLPWALLIPKVRSFAFLGICLFQAMIAYFSGEIDFGFTAFAILFLFVPRISHLTYALLACIFLLVQPWI